MAQLDTRALTGEMSAAEFQDKYCGCYVQHLGAETRFSLHHGAHNPTCPLYRVRLDPVDRAHDEAFRARVETENAAFDSKRPALS